MPVLCQFVVTQLVRIFSDIWVAVWVRKVRKLLALLVQKYKD